MLLLWREAIALLLLAVATPSQAVINQNNNEQQYGCDLLLDSTTSRNIINECSCKDSDGLEIVEQLTCSSESLAALGANLRQATVNSTKQIRVSYFNVNLNDSSNARPKSSRNTENSRGSLQVEHIFLQSTHISEPEFVDFLQTTCDEIQLKSLTIHISARRAAGGSLKFSNLLARLTNLDRFEVNLGADSEPPDDDDGPLAAIRLEPDSFVHQSHLKWLSLSGTNGSVLPNSKHLEASPFAHTPELEHLSLESNYLNKFPLYSMLAIPFSYESHSYYGLPHLSRLSLAQNKLASFESDLFATWNGNENSDFAADSSPCVASQQVMQNQRAKNAKLLFLPALTELDLSSNQLQHFSWTIGQQILCSMPSLNQLYLQHNKIQHVNLNALLFLSSHPLRPFPFSHDHKAELGKTPEIAISSKIEIIDLSHNRLVKLSAIRVPNDKSSTLGAPRVKSINLSYNNLRRPITGVDSELINRAVFLESFDHVGLFNATDHLSLDKLDASFQLLSEPSDMTICDIISPRKANVLPGEDLINELMMNGNNFGLISDKDFASFQCRELLILNLHSNFIAHIAPTAFHHLSSVEQIDLSRNLLQTLDETTFSRSTKLRTLNLAQNRLHSLHKNLLFNLTELEQVLLDHNQLVSIPSDIFAYSNQIQVLDLSHNKLSHLDNSIFSHLNYLKSLNLQNNQLKRFIHRLFELPFAVSPAAILPAQSGRDKLSQKSKPINKSKSKKAPERVMRTRQPRQAAIDQTEDNQLVLSNNFIETFKFDECGVFSSEVHLLSLDSNMLSQIAASFFKCFPNMQRLILSSNQIRTLHQSAFIELKFLEYLDLSHNQITNLVPFADGPYLRHLDISSNLLTDVNFSTLAESTQLEVLDISNNSALEIYVDDLAAFLARNSQISKLGLCNISNIRSSHKSVMNDSNPLQLQSLDLKQIQSVENTSLERLFKLVESVEELDLSFLPSIAARWGRSKVKVTALNLSGSKLNTADAKSILVNLTFKQMSSLNLSSNRLDQWPLEQKLIKTMSRLAKLDLSRNKLKFMIAGDNPEIYTLSGLTELNLSFNSLAGLIEHPSLRARSLSSFMPKLQELDLSHNRLSWIPLNFLDDDTGLRSLKLDHNQLESLPPIYTRFRGFTLDLSHNPRLRSLQFDSVARSSKIHQLDEPEMSKLDIIKLESVEASIDLGHLKYRDDRHIHLDLRYNSLTDIAASRENSNIVALDVGENRLRGYSGFICTKIRNLLNFRLAHNQIREIRLDDMCDQATLLDLSHNQIGKIIDFTSDPRILRTRSLLLHDNSLSQISSAVLDRFEALEMLDLRNNPLKTIDRSMQRYLSARPTIELSLSEEGSYDFFSSSSKDKPNIKLDATSLQMIAKNGPKRSIIVKEAYSGQVVMALNASNPVKFCALDSNSAFLACLNSTLGDECLMFKSPSGLATCLIDLNDVKQTNKTAVASRQHKSDTQFVGSGNSSTVESADPILSLIDTLKRSWIQLKELDTGKLLPGLAFMQATIADPSSTIYTSPGMKLFIIAGAMCTIVLLIIMFSMLFTCHNGDRRRCYPTNNETSSEASSSSLTHKTTATSESQLGPSSAQMSSSTNCSTARSSRSSKDDSQKTILDARMIRDIHSSNLLALSYQQQQQIQCSTPSSSLAPSSVETAETMQAIDSIQSGSSTIVQAPPAYGTSRPSYSIDQSSVDYNDAAKDGTLQRMRPPVATVMRMIKSNSANFEDQRPIEQTSSYGTLTRDDKCSTLRSKIRALNEHQYGYIPYRQARINDQSDSYGFCLGNQAPAAVNVEQDPSTLSLMSINSALSNSTYRLAPSHTVSSVNGAQDVTYGQHQGNLSGALCHYHHQLVTGATDAIRDHPIIEQDEDQFSDELRECFPPPPQLRMLDDLEMQFGDSRK